MKIRQANLEDLPCIMEIGERILRETRLSRLDYNREKLSASLSDLIKDTKGTHCMMLAISSDGTIAGLLIGYVAEYFFSRDRVATNTVFYVEPEFRGSSAAIKLIIAFRKWATNREVSELSLNITSGVRMEQFDSFLTRTGFERTGGNYSTWLK